MNSLIGKLNDGGPLITYTIIVLILVILYLFIQGLRKSDQDIHKKRLLISSLGWFALAWGYMGRTFGLIMSFDNVAAAGEITPSLMAGGLKMALVGPLAGITAFLIARIAILVFILVEKKTLKE